MPPLRLCKDPLTDTLSNQLGANALRVPESGVRPLLVLASHDGQTSRLGDAGELFGLKGAKPKLHRSAMAEIARRDSKRVSARLGGQVLAAMLGGFGAPGVKLGLDRDVDLVFKFPQLQREFIELTDIDTYLRGSALPAGTLLGVLRDPMTSITIINSTVRARGFEVELHGKRGVDAGVQANVLAQAINASAQIAATGERSVVITSRRWLTLAFNCAALQLGPGGTVDQIKPARRRMHPMAVRRAPDPAVLSVSVQPTLLTGGKTFVELSPPPR